MNYVTLSQLMADVRALAARVRGQFDGIVGIPRSGMLPATLLANELHLPCASLPEFIAQVGFSTGGTRLEDSPPARGRVLILDDSCYKGSAARMAVKAVQEAGESLSSWQCEYGAVYGHPDTPPENEPGWIGRVVDGPRLFEWNIAQHADLSSALLDLDGVLCADPPVTDSQDRAAYEAWLPNATPLMIPRVPVLGIITNRLNRYRQQTADWLRLLGVRYSVLLMHPAGSAKERTLRYEASELKSQAYLFHRHAKLFIESDPQQAVRIAEVSRKPVICLTSGECWN